MMGTAAMTALAAGVKDRFPVFGEPVDVLLASDETGGKYCAITQLCGPGGGPPPHFHEREDEIFFVIQGQFDLLAGTEWHRVRQGEVFFAPKMVPHTFRNALQTPSKIMCMATPGGLDVYLKQISNICMPQDLAELEAISAAHGIRFVR